MAATKFEFPDETGTDGPNKKPVDDKDKLEIEVVDDTPPEDRGRDPLPEDLKKEIEEEDLEQYSVKVQQRFKQLKKVYHDERRAKEAAARERDEAVRFAQAREQEAHGYKQRLGAGEQIFKTEITAAAKTQLEAARAKLKAAYDAGDSELIVTAQEALNAAQFKIKSAEEFTPSLQKQKTEVEHQPQTQNTTTTQVDPKAKAWREKNGWFGVEGEMTALSLALHEKLVNRGVDPRSDEYYQQIDSNVRKRFPEYFSDEDARTSRDNSSQRRSPTVVASASRTTGPRRISLNASQVAIAKRLGLTNEAYAREMIKLEQNNG